MTGITISVPEDRIVARFVIPGEPQSKGRHRISNRGGKVRSYTPPATRVAEDAVAAAFRRAYPRHQPNRERKYGVYADFIAASRTRRDVDNMFKLLCDGLNGVAWHDDWQVEEIAGRKSSDALARTEVLIYETGDVERLESPCAWCSKIKPARDHNGNALTFCNRACEVAKRREARMVLCAHCGVSFDGKKPTRPAKFCSRECLLLGRASRRREGERQ